MSLFREIVNVFKTGHRVLDILNLLKVVRKEISTGNPSKRLDRIEGRLAEDRTGPKVEKLGLELAALRAEVNSLRERTPDLAALQPLFDDLTFLRRMKTSEVNNNGERQASPTLKGIRPDHRGRYEFAAELLKHRGGNILDAACGIGYGSYMLAEATEARITGIDMSLDAIHYGQIYYSHKRVRLVHRRLEEFTPDQPFDAICSFETIEHVNDGHAVLSRFHEMLADGGVLVFSTPNEKVMPYSPERFPHHVRHFDGDELRGVLAGMGFKDIRVFSQHNRNSPEVRPDQDGLFLVLTARR